MLHPEDFAARRLGRHAAQTAVTPGPSTATSTIVMTVLDAPPYRHHAETVRIADCLGRVRTTVAGRPARVANAHLHRCANNFCTVREGRRMAIS
jgi:hypothetical protein